MKLTEFEDVLRCYCLTFNRADKDPIIELTRWEPPLVETYWRLVEDGSPPTQEQFCQAVRERAPDLPVPAVTYRAQKAYPSFVREHHAELALTERYHWVFKALPRDYDGVDLLVVRDDNTPVGVALSVETDNSAAWAKVKTKRHPRVPPFPVISLRTGQNGYKVGAFWLHRPKDLAAAVEGAFSRPSERQLAFLEGLIAGAALHAQRRPRLSFADGFRAAVGCLRQWARA